VIQFLRAKAECFARLCHRLGVCLSVRLSVCLSVTLVSCIKTVQARITKSSLWATPRSLVYRDKILCHWVQGFPSNEGVEEGYPLKRRHFAFIGSNNVRTVADRYIHAAYHNKHWWQAFLIYQHRWPWMTLNPKNIDLTWFFGDFWLQKSELQRNGGKKNQRNITFLSKAVLLLIQNNIQENTFCP